MNRATRAAPALGREHGQGVWVGTHGAAILAVIAGDQVPLILVAGLRGNPPGHRIADEEGDLQPAAVHELHIEGCRVALLPDWELLGINLHTGKVIPSLADCEIKHL